MSKKEPIKKKEVNPGFIKPRCPDCGSTQVYYRRKTQDRACRGCGKTF